MNYNIRVDKVMEESNMIKGTFTYDKQTERLTLLNENGEPIPAMWIGSHGISDGITISETQYQGVGLFMNSNKSGNYPYVMIAKPVPIDLTFRPGKWTAYLLASPIVLVNIADWLKKLCNKQQDNPANNGNKQPQYKRPPRAAFVPEFLLYWRRLHYRAMRGWAFFCGVCLGIGILHLLFQIIEVIHTVSSNFSPNNTDYLPVIMHAVSFDIGAFSIAFIMKIGSFKPIVFIAQIPDIITAVRWW